MLYLSIFSLTLVRANLTRVTSPPNSNTGGSRLIFSVLYSYFIFIFYLPRCTLPDFPSVSSLVFLPFLPCHRTTNSSYFSFWDLSCPKNFTVWSCQTGSGRPVHCWNWINYGLKILINFFLQSSLVLSENVRACTTLTSCWEMLELHLLQSLYNIFIELLKLTLDSFRSLVILVWFLRKWMTCAF